MVVHLTLFWSKLYLSVYVNCISEIFKKVLHNPLSVRFTRVLSSWQSLTCSKHRWLPGPLNTVRWALHTVDLNIAHPIHCTMSIAHCRVKTAHSNHYTMGIAQFTLRNTHPNHFFRWAQSHCRVNNAHTNKYSMGIAQCTVCNTHPNHCTMGIAHSRVNNAHSNHYTMDIGHKAVNTTCSIYHSTIVYSVFIRNRAVIRAGIFSDCKNRLSSDKELLDQFKHCNIEILYCCDTSIGTDVCRQPGWYLR